jgi:hypothetical protein
MDKGNLIIRQYTNCLKPKEDLLTRHQSLFEKTEHLQESSCSCGSFQRIGSNAELIFIRRKWFIAALVKCVEPLMKLQIISSCNALLPSTFGPRLPAGSWSVNKCSSQLPQGPKCSIHTVQHVSGLMLLATMETQERLCVSK